jgi:phosphoglycolate phosphatase
MSSGIRAVLFDLDGTLVDTAPDLAAALNRVLQSEGMPPLTLETIRPQVSRGGLALIQLAFSATRKEAELEPLRQKLLDFYIDHIADESRLFEGCETMLQQLEQRTIPWGIVTNKPGWLTDPLLHRLNLDQRSAVTISADTTAQKKPHPLPLLTAAQRIDIDPQQCLYIGDDPRDVEAGNAAGMTTVIARYGYIGENARLDEWQADAIIDHPEQVLNFI